MNILDAQTGDLYENNQPVVLTSENGVVCCKIVFWEHKIKHIICIFYTPVYAEIFTRKTPRILKHVVRPIHYVMILSWSGN